MQYNSQKEPLVIAEYGRNLQNLVSYAMGIEDKEKRQKFAEGLIKLMHQISPQTKASDEAQDRLWNHLFRISDYKLIVDVPDNVTIVKHEDTIAKVKKMPYLKNNSRFRHYGQNIPKLIEKCIGMEEGEKKEAFVEYIAAFMKMVYKTWNQDHYINNDTIKSDLLKMSDNKLVFKEEMNIDFMASNISFAKKKKFVSNSKSNKKKKKSYSKRYSR